MGISGIKSFFSATKPIGKPVVTQCGTRITKWEKGGDTFKRVVFGEGNKTAQKMGFKEFVLKIAKDGKKTFEGIIQNSKGETIKFDSPFWLGQFKKSNYSANQAYNILYIQQLFSKAISKG